MTLHRRTFATLCGLTLLLTLMASPPAEAATRQSVTIVAGTTAAEVGQKVALSGKTTPKAAAKKVRIQQRNAGSSAWRTVKTVTTTKAGTWSTTVTPGNDTDRYYRAYLPARKGYTKASAKTSKIVVDKRTVTVTAQGDSPATVNLATTIRGTVTPYVASSPDVYVQQRDAGTSTWTTVKRLTLDDSGAYLFAWTPDSTGEVETRVYKPARGDDKAGYSPVVTTAVEADSEDEEAGLPASRHSVSLGIEDIVLDADEQAAHWSALRSDLDEAHVNVLHLSAGRVEWTAFDWAAHPEVAADSGTDHLAEAIAALTPMANGGTRKVDLLIDALVPSWIAADPSIAGVDAKGKRATYTPSASAIHDGEVGDRYVELARDLSVRYRPTEITFSEFMFDNETFGADDLALYQRMTGAKDWPRTRSGAIDEDSPLIGAWRSEVLYDLLARVRQALDEVTDQVGHRVELGTDVLVNWDDPTAGRPDVGDDYDVLYGAVDRIILWGYFGTEGRTPADFGNLGAALQASKVPTERFAVSVGLWSGEDEQSVITPAELAEAVGVATSAGLTSVNATPVTLMTQAHWDALAGVWTSWPK
ncbi:MAG: hypothetical protein QM779_13720 [Propionicimonas sp.]|uniref:hypothetical protein n=1 Tax=Propionicimonas sp. TaxID=1955623 RepID=UPI003D10A865